MPAQRPFSAALGTTLAVGLLLLPRGASAADPATDCGDTKIDVDGIDVIYQALGSNGEGTVGPRRLVVDQTGTIAYYGTRTFVQGAPMDTDRATLEIRKTAGKNRTEVTICTTDAAGTKRIARQFEMDSGDANVGQTWRFDLTGLKDRRLSVRLVGKHATRTMSYAMTFERPGAGVVWAPDKTLSTAASGRVVGFADLHNHQPTPEGFGGGVIAGTVGATARFPSCTEDHARAKTGLAGLVVKQHPKEGTATAQGSYEAGHGVSCSTTTGTTTRCWADSVHHKLGIDALKLAHDNGLKLMITHALSNQALCYLAASINPDDHHCSDMESAKLQIHALKAFDDAHDWYEIVRDPWAARRAIAAGRLAVVLGIEVSNIFPDSDGDQIRQLHEVYAMGVSLVYVVHESDSEFAGTAYHHWPTLLVNQELKQLKTAFSGGGHSSLLAWLNPAVRALANDDVAVIHNPKGLEPAGRALLEEMMRLHMIIDIDHLSHAAVDDVYDLARDHDYYPLLAGHTRVESLLAGKTREQTMELTGNDKIFGYIADTGGMVALRTGPDHIGNHDGTPGGNDCRGSVKSFNQLYQWVVDHRLRVAFGTDLGGYVPGVGPRWGADACPLEGADVRAARVAAQGPAPANPPGAQPSGWSTYLDRGLVDIGALPSLLFDMTLLGVDTAPLQRSAEDFLDMWERTYDTQRTRVVLPPGTPAKGRGGAKLPTAD